MRTSLKPTAADAWLSLLLCLVELQEGGRSTPCLRDPEPFTSDDQRERAEAAAACAGCPALVECREFAEANAEPAHVWAGVDRTTGGGSAT
jgi:hypothetical protein